MNVINDNSIQMSVKRIPFYIKVKGKIHDNLSHENPAPTLLTLTVYFYNFQHPPPTTHTTVLHQQEFISIY